MYFQKQYVHHSVITISEVINHNSLEFHIVKFLDITICNKGVLSVYITINSRYLQLHEIVGTIISKLIRSL